MTPQIGRPVQYYGSGGTLAALITSVGSGDVVSLVASTGTAPTWHVFTNVPHDTAHGVNTWDYVPD